MGKGGGTPGGKGIGKLVIRADAGVQQGTGHVMRCLALAQAWMDRGGEVTFIASELPESLARRLTSEGIEIVRLSALPGSAEDARQTAEHARERGAEWVVVDGYRFNYEFQRKLRDRGCKVLLVDDYGQAGACCAEVILDQNLQTDETFYQPREPNTRTLLGTRYALLRREFSRGGGRRDVAAVGRKVLVTLGGSDPDNFSLRVLEGLQQVRVKGLELTVVVGSTNPHVESLGSAVSRFGNAGRMLFDVPDMTESMAWADMAVIAAGGTLWELLCRGCPVLSYARNSVQARVISELGRQGIVRDMGTVDLFSAEGLAPAIETLAESPDERRRMSLAGQTLVDGGGARQVCRALLTNQVEA